MSDHETDPVDGIDGRRRFDDSIDPQGNAHQRLRDVLERIQATRTPPELKAWLLRTVGERRPNPAEVDVSWLSALPMAMPTGVRGGSADRLLACAFDGGELRAQVQFEESGSACSVTGRLVGPDRAPLAARPVALFVDRGPRDSAVTDEHGEFSFDARRGTAFGVRVGVGPGAVHVALIEIAPGKDDRGPTR
jgi:hypothetical protein